MNVKFMGIDAGRTAIKLAYRNNSGDCVRRKIPGDNFLVNWSDPNTFVDTIRNWCIEIDCHLQNEATVVIGAAGATEFEQDVRLPEIHLVLMGDVTLAAASCGIREGGLALLYGTGGALTSYSKSGKITYGSYGPLVGDLWGGVALGRLAVRALIESWNSGDTSSFLEALAAELGIRNRRGYIEWMQTAASTFNDLAKLGEKTVRFAEDGDKRAQELCLKTVDSIVEFMEQAIKNFSQPGPVNVIMQGSIIENSSWIREQLYSRIDNCRWRLPDKALDVYALELAESLG